MSWKRLKQSIDLTGGLQIKVILCGFVMSDTFYILE